MSLILFSPPYDIQASWKTSNAGFISQLKNLQATALSTFGKSLRESFDLLNIHRLHTSIDHYGQGRNPFFLEPAVVIALTDGGKLSDQLSVEDEVCIYLCVWGDGGKVSVEDEVYVCEVCDSVGSRIDQADTPFPPLPPILCQALEYLQHHNMLFMVLLTETIICGAILKVERFSCRLVLVYQCLWNVDTYSSRCCS